MVSGFFTSPKDHSLIFSGEAKEILTALKLDGSFGFEKKLYISSNACLLILVAGLVRLCHFFRAIRNQT